LLYEHFGDVRDAIAVRSNSKGWRGATEVALIEKLNPRGKIYGGLAGRISDE